MPLPSRELTASFWQQQADFIAAIAPRIAGADNEGMYELRIVSKALNSLSIALSAAGSRRTRYADCGPHIEAITASLKAE